MLEACMYIFDLSTLTWTASPLSSSLDMDWRSRYLWVGVDLFCSGGGSGAKAYLLAKGETLTVTELADMKEQRGCHGLWQMQDSVLVFGGWQEVSFHLYRSEM